MNTDNYHFRVEVRDSEGKVIRDDKGNAQTVLSYEKIMWTANMEIELRQLAITLKTFMPDRNINIDVSVLNSISSTYMVMFSYYVNENRFVKH